MSERTYSIGIPLSITAHDDGRIVFDFDLSDVADHRYLEASDVIDDDVFAVDLARIESACDARDNHFTMTARVVIVDDAAETS